MQQSQIHLESRAELNRAIGTSCSCSIRIRILILRKRRFRSFFVPRAHQFAGHSPLSREMRDTDDVPPRIR